MELYDYRSHYDFEMMSVDSDYGSGGSGHSSPCPAATTEVLKQPDAVLYYLIVPPGYHLELPPVDHLIFTEPETTGLPNEKSAIDARSTDSSSAFHRRLVKWSLPPPPVRAANLPGWNPTPYGLEKYWQYAFAWFFRSYLTVYDHLWTMEPVELPPVFAEWHWHSFSYLAKVHFQCPVAKHPGWTSKKGLVNFCSVCVAKDQGDEMICEVLFKSYGQQCRGCNQGTLALQSSFLPALWYPEFVEAAVRSLSIRVDELYYGSSSTDERSISADPSFTRLTRSSWKPNRMPHDASRCQACIEGFCALNAL